MNTHLMYVTSATFPSQLANRKQVVHQSRAFASTNPLLRVTLGIAHGSSELTDEPFECAEAGTSILPLLVWSHIRTMRRESVTHAYCREPRVLTLLIAARALRLIQRNVVIGFEIHSLTIDERLLRIFLKYADSVVAVNPVLAEEASAFLNMGSRVLVAHDAADPALFMTEVSRESARHMLGIDTSEIIAVYTGRFRTLGMDKGLMSVIRAVSNRIDQNVIRIYAVGGTDDEIRSYAQYAAEAGVGEQFAFIPYQTQETVALYHAAADILLMPFPAESHFARAMSPLKLFEYLMAGRAIIATDLPSIADILSTQALFVIAPDSDGALARALGTLSGDSELRNRLGREARRISLRYTWDSRASAILSWLGIK